MKPSATTFAAILACAAVAAFAAAGWVAAHAAPVTLTAF
jgi:hypothetical protein